MPKEFSARSEKPVLTIQVEDRDKWVEFRRLALKEARGVWQRVHVVDYRQPGEHGVFEQCFDAILEGLEESGMKWEIARDEQGYFSFPFPPRVTQGELVNMILKRVPSITRRTAYTHARTWEQDYYPEQLTPQARVQFAKEQRRRWKKR